MCARLDVEEELVELLPGVEIGGPMGF